MLFIVEINAAEDTAKIVAKKDNGNGELCERYAMEKLNLQAFIIKSESISDWHNLTTRQLSRIYTSATEQDPNALFPTEQSALDGIQSILRNDMVLGKIPLIPDDWAPSAPAEPIVPTLIEDTAPAPVPVPVLEAAPEEKSPLILEIKRQCRPEPNPPASDAPVVPSEGTKGRLCWDHFDTLARDKDTIGYSRKQYLARLMETYPDMKEATAITQYGMWRKYMIAGGMMNNIDEARLAVNAQNDEIELARRAVERTLGNIRKAEKMHKKALDALYNLQQGADNSPDLKAV